MLMKRILGVIAGYILWSVLWLGYNQILLMLGVLTPAENKPIIDATPLVLLLMGSVLMSVAAGYVTARIAGIPWALPVAALGVLLLATGIFVQLKMWYLMPLWYHLPFLLLLIPMAFVGGRLYARPASIA
jgi:hypothetical protein